MQEKDLTLLVINVSTLSNVLSNAGGARSISASIINPDPENLEGNPTSSPFPTIDVNASRAGRVGVEARHARPDHSF